MFSLTFEISIIALTFSFPCHVTCNIWIFSFLMRMFHWELDSFLQLIYFYPTLLLIRELKKCLFLQVNEWLNCTLIVPHLLMVCYVLMRIFITAVTNIHKTKWLTGVYLIASLSPGLSQHYLVQGPGPSPLGKSSTFLSN